MNILKYIAAVVLASSAGCSAGGSNNQSLQKALTEEQLVGASELNAYYAQIYQSCELDSDCSLDNVANCCGAYEMCVGKDANTNPEYVKALCEQYDLLVYALILL